MSGVTSLYAFSNFTFTSCGATGSNGPTLAQVYSAYTGVSWSNYISVSGTKPGVQLWQPPASTVYWCEVAGCSGVLNPAASTGAIMCGDIFLDKTKQYQILVGQRGQSASGQNVSGSGGTFLVDPDNVALIIAGGGGGNRLGSNDSSASITTSGKNGNAAGNSAGTGNPTYAGGTNGGGGVGNNGAGGGGGMTGDGQQVAWNGGKAFINGGIGGTSSNNAALGACDGRARNGGFGGGGGTNASCSYICAGGGGYSGGGAAISGSASGNAAGGGGSYSIATTQSNFSLTNGNSNLGYIAVRYSSGVPTTGSISLINLGQRIGVNATVIKVSDLYSKYTSGPTAGLVSFSNYRGLNPIFA